MKHLLIDTDTASDDAVALMMALREPSVRVEAITVVAGNCPLGTCIKNALISVDWAQSYRPPVYAGMEKPLFNQLHTSEHVHGDDGMGNMDLPEPITTCAEGHAVDKIIELAHQFKGELEIVALGPLTNLAMALLKEPRLPQLIKAVYIMGGAGLGSGNITATAEFNFFVDAEAAHLVIDSELNTIVIGWDVCMDETFINAQDIETLNRLGTMGQQAVRCNHSLIEFNLGFGKSGFDLPDPTAVAVAMYPEIVEKQFDAYSYVDYKSERSYAQYVIDHMNIEKAAKNARIIGKINAKMFKQKLFELLA